MVEISSGELDVGPGYAIGLCVDDLVILDLIELDQLVAARQEIVGAVAEKIADPGRLKFEANLSEIGDPGNLSLADLQDSHRAVVTPLQHVGNAVAVEVAEPDNMLTGTDGAE